MIIPAGLVNLGHITTSYEDRCTPLDKIETTDKDLLAFFAEQDAIAAEHDYDTEYDEADEDDND